MTNYLSFRIVLVGLVLAITATAATINVTNYGAKCDGATDDTAAIQAALNAAGAATGGGTVTVPGSTCLLNPANAASDTRFFYNLHIPSGVTLSGTTGSTLLQGPRGRHGVVGSTGYVRNTVLAVGNNYTVVTFSHLSRY
jgi:polygalacturonase